MHKCEAWAMMGAMTDSQRAKVATMGSADAARALGISRRTLLHRVEDGTLVPLAKLSGKTGAYLFEAADVQRLAESKGAGK